MATCTTPDLGRIRKIGYFRLGDCMEPLYGPGIGYIDDCPAGVETSDNIDEGEDFTRRCADGSIKRFVPGVRSLQSIEVNVDHHWIDPEWAAMAGGAQPIIHDGEIVGWSDCTRDRFNLLVVIWQEFLGDECVTEEGCAQEFVRLYPIKDARFTENGTIGAEDNTIRLTGLTTDAHDLGSGPIPLAIDTATCEAAWLSDCIPSGCHRFRFTGAPGPEVCGVMDTVAPTVPCVPASAPAS